MEVIPAINCTTRECVEEKLCVVEHFSKWIHLDVADGAFTFNKLWGEAKVWGEFKTPLMLEVHLMVERPERVAEEWLRVGAKRLIVHVETVNSESMRHLLQLAMQYGASVMLASRPETSTEEFEPYLSLLTEFQVLSVNPGLAGQAFLPLTLEKVQWLREMMPDAIIEVDGGVNDVTGKRAIQAGANVLVAASHIFSHPNPREAFDTLRALS